MHKLNFYKFIPVNNYLFGVCHYDINHKTTRPLCGGWHYVKPGELQRVSYEDIIYKIEQFTDGTAVVIHLESMKVIIIDSNYLMDI